MPLEPTAGDLLITTFTTWMPHQRSNSADDLVELAIARGDLDLRLDRESDAGCPEQPGARTRLLRHLPVENAAASQRVREAIWKFQPAVVLCCGMAESRSRLNLERRAHLDGHARQTRFEVARWCDRLVATDVSDDAGQFVCNYLYFQMLGEPEVAALFLHVPLLTPENRDAFARDFAAIAQNCLQAANAPRQP
ncbi:MAG: peptidase C15 [Geitlerinemataceae cyanobacterium]